MAEAKFKAASRWIKAAREFLQGEALSYAFGTAMPWVAGVVSAAVFVAWSLITGPAGPWLYFGAVATFALATFGVAVFRTLREAVAANERVAIIVATSAIPSDEKGLLDFAAGVEEAISDLNVELPRLTKRIQQIGSQANKHGAIITKAAKTANMSLVKARRLAIRSARAFDSESDRLESRVERLEITSAGLKESFVGLVTLIDNEDALRVHQRNADGLLQALPFAIKGTTGFRDALVGVRKQRVQQDVSRAVFRMQVLVDRILAAFSVIENTCTTVTETIAPKLRSQNTAGARE